MKGNLVGKLDGKVALITGAARGQGRSHAVRLAEEGASIIAIDICEPIKSNVAPPSTEADLAETARMVEGLDRRIVTAKADVRDLAALQAAVASGIAEFGRLDIVVANAGVWTYGLVHELSEEEWREILDINLTGVWNTCKATVPHLIEQGAGGSITMTSSVMGLQPTQMLGHYVASKHGVVGLMKTLALELAPHSIRVNTVNPCTVNTPLVQNERTYNLFAPDIEHPTREQVAKRMSRYTALPVPWVEPQDVSNAILFLASDDARYITGVALPVDAGTMLL